MTLVLLALGSVLIFEGLVYALAPSFLEQMLEMLRRIPEAALRQLRCAVPTVPARRLQEFFVRYLWLLYKLERHSVAQQLMPVAARYVPLLPPWVLPTQLTHGPYLPSAEDGQPVPYHDEWCEASGVCGTVSAAVPELKDELQGLLEALNETEFGVVDAFVPTPAEEQRAKPFGQGGDLVLLDQESGVVNATACAMVPKHCALLRSLPLAFQRMEDPDSRYGWRGVPAQASVRFVNPWSRSTALLTQESNDMLMMFAPQLSTPLATTTPRKLNKKEQKDGSGLQSAQQSDGEEVLPHPQL